MEHAELIRFNPWWEAKEAIEEDKHVREFEAKKIKYYPQFSIEGGTYAIRGPRQVGKTTLMKLMIRELLKKRESKSVFYYSFDMVKAKEQAYEVIETYLEELASDGKKTILLDEITGIGEWQSLIKILLDRGDIKKEDALIVSGSSALDLWKGAETLPGRGIEGKEYFFLPASFKTYCELLGKKLPSINLKKIDTKVLKEELTKTVSLNRLLHNYLNTGGFLSTINEGVTEILLERYMRWIEGDIIKAERNPTTAKEILAAIIRKKCSQLSFDSIRKETSVSSHNTVIDYAEMLEELLVLNLVEKASLNPFKVQHKKEKKLYFRDPLLIKIGEKWATASMDIACKVESVVAEHLNRLTKANFFNDGKREVDFVFRLNKKTIGVEVKWQKNISAGDYLKLNKFDTGFLLTKETFDVKGNIYIMPVSLFLAMLPVREFVKRKFF